ncbi:transcriptional regulator [Mycobacterium sp. GA-1841]|uniref:type 1 glutamine amidotransferase domain-containing protein n=1 Tax=Mycobacterium sp. GA-1841 TaxID=1834154 RepID=UPI00096BEA68|nr:type 1 glutamine amidotransferase domain-containing protein [Mycobacterium sp. GA-1841]OMC39073.1 transcriptional regulator [Mycobacterium sp. GA-1841]
MTKVLMVISAADHWTLKDGTEHPSGYWAEEVARPHQIFTEAGWDITVATPGGKAPTLDKLSLGFAGGMPWKRREVKRYLDSIANVLAHPVALDTVNDDDYDVVFYPGGHGPMEDLAYDPVSGALLAHRLASGKPLALLCHAPAAILAANRSGGTSPVAGRQMTGFSNNEELLNGFSRKAPWLLEDKLKEAGVDFSKALIPLRPHVVVDGNLYTGQNPQSSEKLAERLVADVKADKRNS